MKIIILILTVFSIVFISFLQLIKENSELVIFSIESLVAILFLGVLSTINNVTIKKYKEPLGACILFVFVVFYQLYIPASSDSTDVQIGILANRKYDLAMLSDPLRRVDFSHAERGYALIERTALFDVRKSTFTVDELKIFTDLVEMSFWQWYRNNYPIHWRTEKTFNNGISGYSVAISQKNDAEKNPYSYDAKDLSDNYFYQPKGNMAFPAGTKIRRYQLGISRKIIISNKYYELTINISHSAYTNLEGTILGENLKKHLYKPKEWGARHTHVKFNCKYTNWRKWSTQTRIIREWIQEMMSNYRNDFEFDLVKNDLDKGLETYMTNEYLPVIPLDTSIFKSGGGPGSEMRDYSKRPRASWSGYTTAN